MEFVHKPVLFEEAIRSLNILPYGIYVDGTAGGGGHTRAIAERLDDDGRLVSIDRDPDAVCVVKQRLAAFPQCTVVQATFADLDRVLDGLKIKKINGMLLDLGVSSHQLDTAERGFSFHHDAPLDMRMSQQGQSAADLVNNLSERELSEIIFKYGEERFARSIARRIVSEREKKAIQTTEELAELIKAAVPAAARRDGHPARKTFQALRIAVNGELDHLQGYLTVLLTALRSAEGCQSLLSILLKTEW